MFSGIVEISAITSHHKAYLQNGVCAANVGPMNGLPQEDPEENKCCMYVAGGDREATPLFHETVIAPNVQRWQSPTEQSYCHGQVRK